MRASALKYAYSLPPLRTRREVLDALHDAISVNLPLNLYGAWRVPRRPANFRRGYVLGSNIFFHRSLPNGYWQDFLRQLRKNGPSILARIGWENIGPFTFTEAMHITRPRGVDRWVFDFLAAKGIRDGLYCPVGRWMLVYWSKQVLRLSIEQRNLLFFMAVVSVTRLEEIGVQVPFSRHYHGPRVSAQQLAVLRHASLGATNAQIAALLEIDLASVKTHFRRAREKLQAKTDRQAVAEALRLLLIR